MSIKNDNNEIEEAKKLKQSADIDVLGLMEQRVKTLESEGYPTEEVYVPTKEAYVLIYKIKKLQDEILPANLDYIKENIDLFVEAKKAEIELLQQQVKQKSYKFIIRGFENDIYAEAQKRFNEEIEKLKEGEEIDFKDTFSVQIVSISIDSYVLNDEFVDLKTKTKEQRIDFVISLDKSRQLPILDKAVAKMVLTANDFEKAMTALPF
ncbi:MAG: hypothetical protein LBT99_03170 [Bifidobacteriaceae bacterium]|jgi:hypothetical protein|nr:hypothetical protein [Bifidobacteriaceae bacterium]